MAEETLFKTEQKMSSADISEKLRMIADKIERGENLALKSGDQSVELDTSGGKELEVKVEREESGSGYKTSLELEINWSGTDEEGFEIE